MGLMCLKELRIWNWNCIICNYYYILGVNFRFQLKVCNCCHDIMQKAANFNDVVIVSAK